MFGLRRVALLLTLLAGACTGEIDADVTMNESPDAGVDVSPGDHDAVARAKEWVDAKVPYCQAPNHARDYDTACSSVCTRPNVPAWDAYRSDCSGLVSWAWGLPAPGRVTTTLAPYNTEVSRTINAADLQPGDAINNKEHTMVFVEWLEPEKKARFYEEPGCSSSQPYARQYDATITTISGSAIALTDRGQFIAIRHK